MAANKWEIILTPGAWVPDATNHPSLGVVYNRTYLAFDKDTPEICYSKPFRLPDAYAGGTVTCEICYAMETAVTSGTLQFEVTVEAISDGDTDDTDAANYFDSTVNDIPTTGATVPSTGGHIDVLSGTLANKDGMAAGDMIVLRLARDADDATHDTAAGDARVFWVAIYEA